MATVNDLIMGSNLVPGVIPKLRYRNNVAADAPRWIVSAVRNITDNYDFDELSVPGPIVSLVAQQAVYPISFFGNIPEYVTRFDSFVIQISSPTSVWLELKWRAMKTVKPLSAILGQPVWYTIYGANAQVKGSQTVYIAFNPNNTYPVQASYQRKHPFTDGVSDNILLPDAWLEVIATSAAFIGAEENGISDIMALMKASLYGDPKNPGEPGLIKSLVSSRAQMSNVNERQLNFISGER